MKILWFTTTPSCYSAKSNAYNGGGWISSLEQELKKNENVQLAVCFYTNSERELKTVVSNNTTYYLIPRPKKTFLYNWVTFRGKYDKSISIQKKSDIPLLLNVVEDFRPDIIQIFGTENFYGLISEYVKVPLVLHIQGILSPIFNAFLPPFISWENCLYNSIRGGMYFFREKISWEKNCFVEKEIMKNIKYFIGRTQWDRRIVNLLSPKSKYFLCNEILRSSFYSIDNERKLPETPVFVTTISFQLYKGYDLILKAAKILKEIGVIDFKWKVFGDINPIFIEKKIGISHEEVNVELLGVASEKKIKETLLNSTAYVHTSYADNSPNSLCEASILGVASISTNVGGIPSLIEDGETGFLVPANDPYQMAYLMKYLYENIDKNISMGNKAREIALKRHDRKIIVERMMEIYSEILNSYSN